MTEWQSIRTAPKDGTVIDIWVHDTRGPDGSRIPNCRWANGDWYGAHHETVEFATGGVKYRKATHWMSLPEPPK